MQLPTVLAGENSGVVARRDALGAQTTSPLEKEVELDPGVAANAGARSSTGQVVADEGLHHLALEVLVEAQRVVRNANLLGYPPCIAQSERPAAAPVASLVRAIP